MTENEQATAVEDGSGEPGGRADAVSREPASGGTLAHFQHYLRKDSHSSHAQIEVRYRPSTSVDRDYRLSLRLP